MCLRKNRKPSRMLLGDISSSLFANLRNSMNINVYFQTAVLRIAILWFICGKVCLKKKKFGGVRWIFLFS